MRRLSQRGAALIVAMLVAALAATVAISLAAGQSQWLAAVAQRRDVVQAEALAQAGVQWARQILFEDARISKIDFPGEPWALPLPPTPLENGSIEGRIVDAQSMLNLNNLGLVDAQAAVERARFERLFSRLGLPSALLDTIGDWVDTDGNTRPAGAEDGWYSQQPNAMLAANAPLLRTAELTLVRGVSPATMAALASLVVALPTGAKINLNTAPAPVLASVLIGLDESALPALIADRAKKPYESIAEFRSRLPQGATIDNDNDFSVGSDYFLVAVRARQAATEIQARALLKRGNGGWPAVIWQTME